MNSYNRKTFRTVSPFLAAAGAVVGIWLFGLVLSTGFYALVAVGFCAGPLGGLLLHRKARINGAIVAATAVAASYLGEWWYRPFTEDHSLLFFVQHFGDLSLVTHLMTGINAWIAYSFAIGMRRQRD